MLMPPTHRKCSLIVVTSQVLLLNEDRESSVPTLRPLNEGREKLVSRALSNEDPRNPFPPTLPSNEDQSKEALKVEHNWNEVLNEDELKNSLSVSHSELKSIIQTQKVFLRALLVSESTFFDLRKDDVRIRNQNCLVDATLRDSDRVTHDKEI